MMGLLDMFDGGGFGASGDEFEGGPLSGLLNMLGVKPHGYGDRRQTPQARPQARPQPQAGFAQPQQQARSIAPPRPVAPPTGAAPDFAAAMQQGRAERAGRDFEMFSGVDMQPAPFGPRIPAGGPDMSAYTDPAAPNIADFIFGPNNSQPMAQPMPQDMPTPSLTGLSFDEFVAGLGPAASGVPIETLRQAYAQHMAGYM